MADDRGLEPAFEHKIFEELRRRLPQGRSIDELQFRPQNATAEYRVLNALALAVRSVTAAREGDDVRIEQREGGTQTGDALRVRRDLDGIGRVAEWITEWIWGAPRSTP